MNLSINALRHSYRHGLLTPSELVNRLYDLIESKPLNPVWISLTPRAEAVAVATNLATTPNLPLWGIPFAVKDNIDVCGLPTTAGCPEFAFMPRTDAFVVARLLAAGAILIGKTNLDQFATGLVGTRSPHGACSCVFDSRYISGGSSSGSAVAVASGLVTFSLGTDTAGSGRIPAAFNNIVGLKATRGVISASGVVPACKSLDCVSIFALSAHDAEAVFDVARGFDPADPFSRSYSPVPPSSSQRLRIGTPRPDQLEFFGNTEYQRLYQNTLLRLEAAGNAIAEIDLTPFRESAELLYAGPYVAERFAAVGAFVKAHLAAVNAIVASIVTASERWTAADAYQALYKLKMLEKQTEHSWADMDVLLLPTAPTTYTIDEIEREPVKLNSRLGHYTNFANLLDLCGIALPAGFTSAGLPFGVTIFGRAFTEAGLLAFAGKCERENSGSVFIGVVGAHLSGQPLNQQLTDRGATLLRTARTHSSYQMFALTNTKPPKPGLIRVPGFAGPGIEIEIWSIDESQFGSFVAGIPPPLSIGTCELSDGTSVKGFLCEPYAAESMANITHLASWRAFLATSS